LDRPADRVAREGVPSEPAAGTVEQAEFSLDLAVRQVERDAPIGGQADQAAEHGPWASTLPVRLRDHTPDDRRAGGGEGGMGRGGGVRPARGRAPPALPGAYASVRGDATRSASIPTVGREPGTRCPSLRAVRRALPTYRGPTPRRAAPPTGGKSRETGSARAV